MLRKIISYGGVLLLAGATGLVTPGLAHAQRGGRFGGAHFGGAHFGGAHFSGARIGGAGFGVRPFIGARLGGYRGLYPYGYRGYYPSYGSSYYPSYGLSTAYPYYDSNPYAYATNPYAWQEPAYDPSVYVPSGDGTPASSDGSTPAAYDSSAAAVQTDTSAHFTVKVPADARLWFNGWEMPTGGKVLQFASLPLTPGRPYSYNVQARWTENGQAVTQTSRVVVSAGDHVNVTFPVPADSEGQASARSTS
jgi:uncharacterized protein (TIGR03000 family)